MSEVLWRLETLGFQELEEEKVLSVRAFFPQKNAVESFVSSVLEDLKDAGVRPVSCSASTFKFSPETGLDRYRRSFRQFGIGKNLFVHPSWSKPSPRHAVNILMEPSLAFGTGSHESTRLALQALESIVPSVKTMLDVGTGSGILAIAAWKLKPELIVTALDIDPLAVHTAAQNLRRNRVGGVRLFAGEVVSLSSSFDLVAANLTQGLFEQLAGELGRLCDRHLVLSGIVSQQTPGIMDLFSRLAPFTVARKWQENEWVCLHLTR